VIVACHVACGSATAQTTDTIVPNSGTPLRGTIVGTSKDGLTLEVAGQQRQVAANEIRYVAYGGEPAILRQIRDAANKGNTERAQRYLDTLSRDKIDRDLVRVDLQFYEALVTSQKAIATGTGLAEAGRALRLFASEHRDSFHFYRAAEALGDVAVAMQRPDDAARFYGVLEKTPWADVRLRGTVKMANALRTAGGEQNLAEALRRYEALIAATVDGDEAKRQQQWARLGQAICQADLGRAAEAIPAVEQVLAATPTEDADLLAAGYNALGRCYGAAERPKDAALAFLRVELLFPQQQSARAEALYHLGGIWDQLGHADRAAEARQLLQDNFPDSTWARKLAAAQPATQATDQNAATP
jgi:tetratricopeptide (TPR) repeat protein